jgi:CRP-like cAMP-binding protein
LRHTDEQVAEMAFLQPPVRLAKALLRMADVGDGSRVQLSQRESGNIVGTTRESVNKCLREWQRHGIVKVEDNAVVIAKRPALEQAPDGG